MQDRTEQPTQKKLHDAREKGQIARSRDLATAAASVAAILALAGWGAHIVEQLAARTVGGLAHFGDAPLQTPTAADLSLLVGEGLGFLAMMAGPVALATIVASVGMNVLQGGWNFSAEALQFNWSRLSPVNGFKRFGLSQAGPDTLKMIVTVSALAFVGWQMTQSLIADTERFAWLSPPGSAHLGWTYSKTLLTRAAWVLVALGLADYGLQWFRLRSSLKMTKQEVRDEAKESDGSAETKGRIRRIQRDIARRRMMSDVGRATVVITNPTHYAIALEYRRDGMSAPTVLAKGRDHVALAIRAKAREHGVPIVENRPLAQTLYKTAEVGDAIPATLFAAVAEVLAYLVRIKQLML